MRHTPQERLPGRRAPPPPSSACLRQRSRNPSGSELSDLVTSRLPCVDALQGRASTRRRFLPDERCPRRQVRGGINQAFCGIGVPSPRQHHPRRSGRDEDRKGLAMVLCGSRRRRRAGWGAELVAVAVPRRTQPAGVQPACPLYGLPGKTGRRRQLRPRAKRRFLQQRILVGLQSWTTPWRRGR